MFSNNKQSYQKSTSSDGAVFPRHKVHMKESNIFKEFGILIVVALLLHLILRTFFFETFRVPTGSMIPTIMVGDHILVQKYAYGYGKYSTLIDLPLNKRIFFSQPQRGDIIIFKSPRKGDNKKYIKRLIGLPGDRVIVNNGIIYINGEEIFSKEVGVFPFRTYKRSELIEYQKYIERMDNDKQYVIISNPYYDKSDFPNSTPVYEVPKGHYFFMGDHRDNSRDNRFLDFMPFVPENNLIGKAVLVLWNAEYPIALLTGNVDVKKLGLRLFISL